jgi:hypothetical protein
MQSRWIRKNIDLKLLCEILERFFEDKGFLTNMQCSSDEDEYKIIAVPKSVHNLREHVEVIVRGEPNDFLVVFEAGRRSRSFVKLGWLTSSLGGGWLLSRGLKSLEVLQKIEEDFWRFLDEKIDFLSKV